MTAPRIKKPRIKAGQSKQSAEQRRKLFVEALLSNNENVTKAALAAGFSPKSAASQGSRLLKNDKVQQELSNRRADLLAKVKLTTESVLNSAAQVLFFDPRKLYRQDGTLKALHELDDDTAMALSGIEISEEFTQLPGDKTLEPQAHGGELKRSTGRKVVSGKTVKFKWHDKNTARDQAARMLGMYEKDNRQRTDPLAALIAQLGRTALPVVPEDPDHGRK